MTITNKNPVLVTYTNNDYHVFIKHDGTKIRVGETFNPIHPESMDMKITNYCDLGCAFCHEVSTIKGKHADTSTILSRLEQLPKGIELAIGGGNPLDHPDLIELLKELKIRGFIVNLTVNSEHLIQQKYIDIMDDILQWNLIYGLGISGLAKTKYETLPNTVNHFIIGEYSVDNLKEIINRYKKVLFLGYKTYGLGKHHKVKHIDRIESAIKEQKDYLHSSWKNFTNTLSFDNLAIEQLNIKDMLGNKFESFYMGDDGLFTMYYDGVTDMYAKSSTSPRKRFTNTNEKILNVFRRY